LFFQWWLWIWTPIIFVKLTLICTGRQRSAHAGSRRAWGRALRHIANIRALLTHATIETTVQLAAVPTPVPDAHVAFFSFVFIDDAVPAVRVHRHKVDVVERALVRREIIDAHPHD
jgi:hypothetical protein